MAKKDFYKFFIFCIVLSFVSFFGLSSFLSIYKYMDFAIFAILFFGITTVVIYNLGERAIKQKNKNSFFSIMIMNIMTKLFGSFIFVLIYVKLTSPDDRNFLIPFLIIYLIFMIYETYFLSIQAKHSRIS